MDKKNSRLNVTSKGAYVKPKDSIICKTCVYRNSGIDGYKKGICSKFDHKPLNILFNNAPCELFKEDAK